MVWRQTSGAAPRNRGYYRFRHTLDDGHSGRGACFVTLRPRLTSVEISVLEACGVDNNNDVNLDPTKLSRTQYPDNSGLGNVGAYSHPLASISPAWTWRVPVCQTIVWV